MLALNIAQFPSHAEKNKDKEWIKKFVKACYDDFASINTDSFYAGRDRYAAINRYMIGKQDPLPSIKAIDSGGANTDKTSLKIPKTVLSIASKYARMMTSTLSKSEWSIDIQAIDPTSIEENTDYYAQNKARLVLQKEFQEAGLNPDEFFEKTDKEFQNEEDLDLYMEYSYKHRLAIEAEQAIRIVMNNCEFDSIRQAIIKQLVYFGFGGYKDYFDQNGDVKVRFVDVNNFIVSRSMYQDFRDAQYMGEVLDLSISDVKQLDIDKEITEEQWQTLAKTKMGVKGQAYGSIDHVNPEDYEMYRIKVLDVEFYSVNDILIEKGQNKIGNLAVSTKSSTASRSKNNQYESKEYAVVYEGKWIVGTDIYFGCKLQTNMKRAKNNISDVKMSYHAICPMLDNMETKSIGEDMIPVQNMIQLLWTKYQEAIIRAKTKGIAIEIAALENIPLGKGGEVLTPGQMLKFYEDTGNLVYRRIGEGGENISWKPIDELENGIGDEAMRWFREIQSQISLLQQITGYNEITDGSTPEARTLNGVAKLASESTNNSIDFMKRGERHIYESLLFSVLLRIQDAAKIGKLEGYINALGKNSIEFFKLSPEISARELGLSIKDAPNAYEKESLQQMIQLAIQTDQITLADSFVVKSVPNIKHAEAILALRIKKRMEDKQAMEIQKIEANSKTQQESAMVASQMRQQEAQFEIQSKTMLLQAEQEKELAILDRKYAYELQLKEMEVTGRVIQKEKESEAKIYVADRQSKDRETNTTAQLFNSNAQMLQKQEYEKEMGDKEEANIENEEED